MVKKKIDINFRLLLHNTEGFVDMFDSCTWSSFLLIRLVISRKKQQHRLLTPYVSYCGPGLNRSQTEIEWKDYGKKFECFQ